MNEISKRGYFDKGCIPGRLRQMSEGLEVIACSTAEALFEAIRPRPRARQGKPPRSTIFRGQGDADHKLIPKALRSIKREQAEMLVFDEWAMLCDFVRA